MAQSIKKDKEKNPENDNKNIDLNNEKILSDIYSKIF